MQWIQCTDIWQYILQENVLITPSDRDSVGLILQKMNARYFYEFVSP